jgi:molybdopterin-binding protein
MKLSARNQLKGKITEVKKGVTTAHVWIDVGGQTILLTVAAHVIVSAHDDMRS